MYDLQKNVVKNDFLLTNLATEPFENSGLLRFYLCDNEGNQISPNFNFSNNTWFADTTQLGFNWAWRPYFYEVLALNWMRKRKSDRFL